MSNQICNKTMRVCVTPGMCAPFGGCGNPADILNMKLTVKAEFQAAEIARLTAELAKAKYIPEGYVLVPKTITDAMFKAAHKLPEVFGIGDEYAAMIAAAPKPE